MIENKALTLAVDLSDVPFLLRQGRIKPSEESLNTSPLVSRESNVFV